MIQDPPRPPMRLNRRHERWLYGISAVVLGSGIGWLVDHYFFAGPSDFGDAHAPFEPWWLRLHGAAAMAALVVLGSLFPGHIARAWRLRLNRRSGLAMLSVVGLLVVTGWALYYLGDEETRGWISVVHWAVGLAAAAGLALHVWLGKRQTRRPNATPLSDESAGAQGDLIDGGPEASHGLPGQRLTSLKKGKRDMPSPKLPSPIDGAQRARILPTGFWR